MYYSEKSKEFTFCDLGGLTYVKNSDGKTSNINFFVRGSVNTETDEVTVKYRIEVFEEGQSDYYDNEFSSFKNAQSEYNRLAEKFRASKEIGFL